MVNDIKILFLINELSKTIPDMDEHQKMMARTYISKIKVLLNE